MEAIWTIHKDKIKIKIKINSTHKRTWIEPQEYVQGEKG